MQHGSFDEDDCTDGKRMEAVQFENTAEDEVVLRTDIFPGDGVTRVQC